MTFKCRACGTTNLPVAEPEYHYAIKGLNPLTGSEEEETGYCHHQRLVCIGCNLHSRVYTEECINTLGLRDLQEQ